MSRPTGAVVLSHLRWNFVYQRPQHLLSRLGANRRILFIEEPSFDESASPSWDRKQVENQVLVCRPRTPVHSPGFHDDQIPFLKDLITQLIDEEHLEEYVLWFYTPMALPITSGLTPRAVVYDCMDELSAFRFAPPELLV